MSVTSPTSTRKPGLLAMALGSIGVVYGDIGTSPLYGFREALYAAGFAGAEPLGVIGLLSLVIWAIISIVTLKYVVLVLRADNNGEGGILSLMALADASSSAKQTTRTPQAILLMGMMGAALFYGDALITPAISVLSAMEGLTLVQSSLDTLVLPLSLLIIVLLFVFQSRGTHHVGRFFGPVMVVWFAVLAIGGLRHIADQPQIWQAFNPAHGIQFLMHHGMVGFFALGAVFLTVTGAEALYADLGHFGKKPVRLAWLWFVMPSLLLNYLGQGALVLAQPEAASNPFYLLYPDSWRLPMVLLATMATVIASQAVISGAFSLTHQAIQLGMLPRLRVLYTSEHHEGQIYIPSINWLIMLGVLLLIMHFGSSGNLAAAYGIAVTGTMLITTMLLFIVMRRAWKWALPLALVLCLPMGMLDMAFLSANMLKVAQGGYVPLLISAFLIMLMKVWVRGCRELHQQTHHYPTMDRFLDELRKRPPPRVPGTAVFFTSNIDYAPSALLQNYKHNHVVHDRNLIIKVCFEKTPYADPQQHIRIEPLPMGFTRVFLHFGFMESPNVLKGILLLREHDIHLEMMSTTFFLSRRNIIPSASFGMPLWQDRLFIALTHVASDAADYFHIPSSRVVELGMQMTV